MNYRPRFGLHDKGWRFRQFVAAIAELFDCIVTVATFGWVWSSLYRTVLHSDWFQSGRDADFVYADYDRNDDDWPYMQFVKGYDPRIPPGQEVEDSMEPR